MLRDKVSQYFRYMQRNLFRGFEEDFGTLTDKHRDVIVALDVVQVNRFTLWQSPFLVGRPPINRDSILRAFVAKAVLNIPTTVALLDRLKVDIALRRICGFDHRIPSLGTFSNAFAEFAESGIADLIHETLVREVLSGKLICHVSRDSTAIEGREKPYKPIENELEVLPTKETPTRKKGRPKKGEEPSIKEPTRLERHMNMDLDSIKKDLPNICDVGGKKNSQGNTEWWVGYKLHLDVDDHGIPLTAFLTSASVHDSQVAILLERMTNERVTSLYSVMDAAYNSPFIEQTVANAGKVSIIDPKKPRGGEKIPLDPAKQERFKIRTSVERTNSDVKDNFGGRFVRVRGHLKVQAHLMFGVLAMTALRLVQHYA
jgi:hypothetical protein